MTAAVHADRSGPDPAGDPREPVGLLLRDLRARPTGLSARDAERRRIVYGPNELTRRARRGMLRPLIAQFTHPLALLLWLAALLAALGGTLPLTVAIVAVIILNAVFAFVQEQQAERAVEALARYLSARARVLRDGEVTAIDAVDLVPGDVMLVEEGERICADARMLEGAVEVDLSTLNGESQPAFRSADLIDRTGPLLDARDLLFSGTSCTGGQARALVFATGMRTELGRIAALSQRVDREESPLEHQVKRVAWLIAIVAVGVGVAFLPIGTLVAGLPLVDALNFAIGLLVANVPEGLLPTITLSLAVGVRILARRGAVVKRLSAVETLGSTGVICTDKTGTLTRNQMRVTDVWTGAGSVVPPGPGIAPAGSGAAPPGPGTAPAEPGAAPPGPGTAPAEPGIAPPGPGTAVGAPETERPLALLARTVAACNTAEYRPADPDAATGDPTELALLYAAAGLGADVDPVARARHRLRLFHFDPALRLMSTVDEQGDRRVVRTKGAPEAVLPHSTRIVGPDGRLQALDDPARARITAAVDGFAQRGLRVIAVAYRDLGGEPVPQRREQAERDLALIGVVAMFDPPRPEVAEAVGRCQSAGIRLIVVTGDMGLTALEIARQVGIARDGARVITGAELEGFNDADLDAVLRGGADLIFARSSPEAKLRIADSLRDEGKVVAMTGDGVNDAPALRRADIGVAMGRSGTDVAREAATMVLTDDNFATIVAAVEAGRQVYDNVRKFIVYIFAHATPEVLPFLVFALSGGKVPLPLTVLQILAVDLGTETLPALALGREPAEPGLMDRPPRPRGRSVIDRPLLLRSWLLLGGVSAILVLLGFFVTLLHGGWHPGDPVEAGTALHHTWQQATTMTFLGIVACQIGTAFAARTESASLRAVGLTTNHLLLWGIAFELVFAAAVVALPPLQPVFGTAVPAAGELALLLPFPVIVWGADELWRWRRRRHRPPNHPAATARS